MAYLFINMIYFEIQKTQRVSSKVLLHILIHQNIIFHQSVPLMYFYFLSRIARRWFPDGLFSIAAGWSTSIYLSIYIYMYINIDTYIYLCICICICYLSIEASWFSCQQMYRYLYKQPVLMLFLLFQASCNLQKLLCPSINLYQFTYVYVLPI